MEDTNPQLTWDIGVTVRQSNKQCKTIQDNNKYQKQQKKPQLLLYWYDKDFTKGLFKRLRITN